MSALNNYLVITDKSDCYRWLYSLNESFGNLIFVEPNDLSRIESLLDSLDINTVLVHLPSQTISTVTISDELVSPGITAVISHLDDQPEGSLRNINNVGVTSLSKDLGIVEQLLQERPTLRVIAILNAINQNALLTIMRAGVCDVIKIGSLPHEASAIIAHHSNRPSVVKESPLINAEIITVVNARAEDGSSLLAMNLALEMQSSGPTLLVDLGVPYADIMLIMGISAKFSFIDVVNNRSRLDSTLIETGFAKHASGLLVLGLPEIESGDINLTPQDMHLAFYDLKQYFKYIVINHAGLSDLSLLKVSISLANTNLFLVEQTIPSCKRTFDLLQQVRAQKFQINNPKLIVDKYSKSEIPSAQSISESLTIPLVATLAPCERARLTTLNTGESIVEHSPRSAYAKAVKELMHQLIKHKHVNKHGVTTSIFLKLQNLLTAKVR